MARTTRAQRQTRWRVAKVQRSGAGKPGWGPLPCTALQVLGATTCSLPLCSLAQSVRVSTEGDLTPLSFLYLVAHPTAGLLQLPSCAQDRRPTTWTREGRDLIRSQSLLLVGSTRGAATNGGLCWARYFPRPACPFFPGVGIFTILQPGGREAKQRQWGRWLASNGKKMVFSRLRLRPVLEHMLR